MIPKRNSKIINFILRYKKQIGIIFLLNFLSSGFLLIAPYMSRLFIDKAFLGKDFAKFMQLSAIGAIIFIFSTFFSVIQDFIKNRISIKFKSKLLNQFIKKFYSLDMSFFQSRSTGENIYRFSDSESVGNFILEQCPSILVDIFKLPVILGISLYMSVNMTAALLILSPFFLIHSMYIQKKLRPIYEETWKYSSNLSRELYEAFSKILIIKVFGQEFFQRHNYIKAFIKNIRWQIKSFRWSIISSIGSSFISKTIYGLITLYGGWLIIKGKLTIGSYTAIMLYLTQLGSLLQSFANRFEFFAREAVSLDRFLEVMDEKIDIKDSLDAVAIEGIKGNIEFKNLNFGYEKNRLVLKDLNFNIPANKFIGIVGLSGCGKTTLINIILRLYDPQEGKILIDGLNLKDIKLSSFRRKTAIATQQPLLFSMSIKDNITYGLKKISQDKIEESAKICCVDEYISQLPDKYNTLIGEDACKLSQGLKQRVALARAIVREPDLLILDEATSSVDSFTEEKIFKSLREKRRGLSTIVISHRLFSIKDADRIYFLQEGGIIEQGAHTELLSRSGLYKEFFLNQFTEDQNVLTV